ncbi:hypothetical protein GBAR_LOCUS16453 [Geodia barretti]|uniref:Uncharacterized protein n=1 Tax=Geodia barretti TaxID=519541 RepID=A0AA35SGY2_GEOBA|nr:hypothetical protein GBAR_LOCUS16453 [Geodia barretti]
MQYPDEEMKDVLELRERITLEAEKLEERLEYARRHIHVLDLILKSSSYTRASSLKVLAPTPAGPDPAPGGSDTAGTRPPKEPAPGSDREFIRRDRGGKRLARFDTAADEIAITLEGGLGLKADIPPLKTFFLDRIIGDMKRKDEQAAEGAAIECLLEQDGGELRRIIVRNYRTKDRAKEIRSSIGWTLSRMLEKIE